VAGCGGHLDAGGAGVQEAGPPKHHDDKVDLDNKEVSLSGGGRHEHAGGAGVPRSDSLSAFPCIVKSVRSHLRRPERARNEGTSLSLSAHSYLVHIL